MTQFVGYMIDTVHSLLRTYSSKNNIWLSQIPCTFAHNINTTHNINTSHMWGIDVCEVLILCVRYWCVWGIDVCEVLILCEVLMCVRYWYCVRYWCVWGIDVCEVLMCVRYWYCVRYWCVWGIDVHQYLTHINTSHTSIPHTHQCLTHSIFGETVQAILIPVGGSGSCCPW